MNILHWMRKEKSGLATSTLELAVFEEKAGHKVCIKQPSEDQPLYGLDRNMDVHCIHSQINPRTYHDDKPKFLWCHGEPLSSVGNGVSMKAIVDMAPICNAFICMRKEEHSIWNSIKKTYLVPKGIDLEKYKPLEDPTLEKLSGEPAVLYYENWRRERNPLYAIVAMQAVFEKFPNARLHLYNVTDKRMLDTFRSLIDNNKWSTFVRSIQGPVEDVNKLLNRADIIVSCLHPLYARSIEAFGAGKGLICPGYRETGYPYSCELEPGSMADAIIDLWEDWGKIDFRKWAKEKHDVAETVKESIAIYERFL
jgi:glycosyltransferase involved in cell wall biosynthesis